MSREANTLIREQAAAALAQHVMVEEPVRSFRFHGFYLDRKAVFEWQGGYPFAKGALRETAAFRYDSAYAFTLTWTPGHITLVGDLGELTLVHYSALRRFEDIGWALSADHAYLMSKTDRKKEYSAEKTLADVVSMLNEEPLQALNGGRTWRGPAAGYQRTPGYRHELQAYRVEKTWNDRMFADADLLAQAIGGEAPEWEDFETERPDGDPNLFERTRNWRQRYGSFERNRSLDDLWSTPDCWNGWLRVWRKLEGYAYDPEYSQEQPTAILNAGTRRRLKDEMASIFDEGAHPAADFLRSVGFDDFYGSDVWPSHTYWQIAAIQHGVRMILAAQQPAVVRLAGAA